MTAPCGLVPAIPNHHLEPAPTVARETDTHLVGAPEAERVAGQGSHFELSTPRRAGRTGPPVVRHMCRADEQQVRRFFVSFGPELGAAGRNHEPGCPFSSFTGFNNAPFPGAGVPMSPFCNPFFNPGCGPGFNPFAKAKSKTKGLPGS